MTVRDAIAIVGRIGIVAATAVVTWASLAPIDRIPVAENVSDKVLHLAAYTVLGALAAFAQRQPRVVLTILLVTAFGLLLEVLQWRTGYRSFDLRDLLSDAIGAALGVLVVALILSVGDRPTRQG